MEYLHRRNKARADSQVSNATKAEATWQEGAHMVLFFCLWFQLLPSPLTTSSLHPQPVKFFLTSYHPENLLGFFEILRRFFLENLRVKENLKFKQKHFIQFKGQKPFPQTLIMIKSTYMQRVLVLYRQTTALKMEMLS